MTLPKTLSTTQDSKPSKPITSVNKHLSAGDSELDRDKCSGGSGNVDTIAKTQVGGSGDAEKCLKRDDRNKQTIGVKTGNVLKETLFSGPVHQSHVASHPDAVTYSQLPDITAMAKKFFDETVNCPNDVQLSSVQSEQNIDYKSNCQTDAPNTDVFDMHLQGLRSIDPPASPPCQMCDAELPPSALCFGIAFSNETAVPFCKSRNCELPNCILSMELVSPMQNVSIEQQDYKPVGTSLLADGGISDRRQEFLNECSLEESRWKSSCVNPSSSLATDSADLSEVVLKTSQSPDLGQWGEKCQDIGADPNRLVDSFELLCTSQEDNRIQADFCAIPSDSSSIEGDQTNITGNDSVVSEEDHIETVRNCTSSPANVTCSGNGSFCDDIAVDVIESSHNKAVGMLVDSCSGLGFDRHTSDIFSSENISLNITPSIEQNYECFQSNINDSNQQLDMDTGVLRKAPSSVYESRLVVEVDASPANVREWPSLPPEVHLSKTFLPIDANLLMNRALPTCERKPVQPVKQLLPVASELERKIIRQIEVEIFCVHTISFVVKFCLVK